MRGDETAEVIGDVKWPQLNTLRTAGCSDKAASYHCLPNGCAVAVKDVGS